MMGWVSTYYVAVLGELRVNEIQGGLLGAERNRLNKSWGDAFLSALT